MVVATFAILFAVYGCTPTEAPSATETTTTTTEETSAVEPQTEGTIVEVLSNDPNYSTLVDLVSEAELVEALQAEGPLTVFAPTNEVFAALSEEQLAELRENKELLRQVLLNHVAEGDLDAAKVTQTTTVTTLAGETIPVTVNGDQVEIGAAKVTRTDIKAKNGVIHVIDAVLMPTKK
jgi:uncharacterized surface protein with fasciclin (FAS1) repeats